MLSHIPGKPADSCALHGSQKKTLMANREDFPANLPPHADGPSVPGGPRATAPPGGKVDPGALTVEQAGEGLPTAGGMRWRRWSVGTM